MKTSLDYDVIIIGAGAAGLMCGVFAGRRGRRVLILENTSKIGEKIRISGGGRCNFTNINASYKNYLSENPHFMKSALAQFDQHDFIKMVEAHGISYHEKTLGQLFCDQSSKQIIDMLLDECEQGHVRVQSSCCVRDIEYSDYFNVMTEYGTYTSESLVIASGGLSIPKIGATDFGYRMAKKFGVQIIPTRPALVPLTVTPSMQPIFSGLSGISNPSVVRYGKTSFQENILFTHKGLSGPAILQISSYLKSFEGEKIQIDLLPETDLEAAFMQDKNLKQTVQNYLKSYLPNRFVETLAQHPKINQPLTDVKKEDLQVIAAALKSFNVILAGSEGYAKAEVTAGGVDTNALSSKTMATKALPKLFFIGEVVDVTGWLGGYNFQWAWSSGYVAGHYC
ncbi:MAG: NAD(P)/FAD-dependent oxidoreductase [Alphaproteobacteria bacterium]|nr:NAD(P)/FAD-dependent oxidoreductase [Alphaproteobacteria bacterium]